MSRNHADFTIRYLSADGQPTTIQVGEHPLVVGSSTGAHIQISARSVSRQHFRAELRDGRMYVTDLGSRNGTFLNGQQLQANQAYEWRPGDKLRIPEVEFQLVSSPISASFASPSKGEFHLSASPGVVKDSQVVKLSLLYQGNQEQFVTLQAQSLVPGFEVTVNPNGGSISPDGALLSEAHIRKTRPFFRGGEFQLRFAANAVSGLMDTAEVVVKVRPRYELLLLLLLFTPFLLAPSRSTVEIALATPIPTVTDELVSTHTFTPQPTVTLTATPMPTTIVPTVVTPSICTNQCAAYGWSNYLIQPDDTLYSLALSANTSMSLVQQVNCISDVNQLLTGSNICLPVTPPPQDLCEGFRPTSPYAFPQGRVDFYWDAPTKFIPTEYRLEIFKADTGDLLTTLSINAATTTTNVDVSWTALGSYPSAIWRIHALVDGSMACSGELNVPVVWPTDEPPRPETVDLVVSSINAQGEWGAECSSFDIDVQYTVTNQGNLAAGTFASNSYYLYGTEITHQCGLFNATVCPETALNGGQSTTFSHIQHLTFGEGRPDSVLISAAADISGYGTGSNQCRSSVYCNVEESSETNNLSAVISVPIPECGTPEPQLPDLVVASLEPIYGRAQCAGESFYDVPVQVTILNQGDGFAPVGIPLVIEMSEFEGAWTPYVSLTTVNDIGAGDREIMLGSVRINASSFYFARAAVNTGANAVPETDTSNNTSPAINFALDDPPACDPPDGLPDLTVVITEGPSIICPDGCVIALNFTVANDTDVDINDGFEVVIDVHRGDQLVGEERFTIESLGARGSENIPESLAVPDSCNDPSCVVTVSVDTGSSVAESNEDNNSDSGSTAPIGEPDIEAPLTDEIIVLPLQPTLAPSPQEDIATLSATEESVPTPEPTPVVIETAVSIVETDIPSDATIAVTDAPTAITETGVPIETMIETADTPPVSTATSTPIDETG